MQFKQQFLEDIRNSSLCRDPPNTLDELVECYNNTLRSDYLQTLITWTNMRQFGLAT